MINLIYAELYKLWKNRSVLAIGALSLIPFVFAFMVSLNLKSMKIADSAFSLLTYPQSMWQFVYGFYLPILVMTYLSCSLGRELKNGSLVYEVTRVANRKKIVYARMLTIVLLNLAYFLVFQLVSILSYMLFINNTRFGNGLGTFQNDYVEILLSLFTLLLQMILCLLTFVLSIKFSAIISVMISLVISILISLCSGITVIRDFIPGAVFYGSQFFSDSRLQIVMFEQSIEIILLIVLAVFVSQSLFKKVSV